VVDVQIIAAEMREKDIERPDTVNGVTSVQNLSLDVGNGADDEPEPISIKEMLIRLDGVFPMDEAVIEGKG